MTNDSKDCEQYNTGNICCTCRNREWYTLYSDYKAKERECEELQHKVNVLSEALIRVNEIARGVRSYLTPPTSVDVRYEMDLILNKVKECKIESDKNNN